LLSRPLVHADFAGSAALAAPHEQRAATMIQIGLVECELFADA
jgi:hypothetical protein